VTENSVYLLKPQKKEKLEMKINLTARQANFLGAFEASYGRPSTVDRATLLVFKTSWSLGQQGPLGFTLRYPAWLTNSGTFTSKRANYTLPWDAYDEWLSSKGAAPIQVANIEA